MSTRVEPLSELFLPDGTEVAEHDLVTDKDILIGGQSEIEFGVRGKSVIGGERVRFGGDIEASEDCRLDMWCTVAGDVLVGTDAYLGERVSIEGRLVVSGDLDIGDDVQIEEGFEAKGWIVIRNPMPTIVFLFVYLGHLLRLGEEEAATELLSDVLDDEPTEGTPLTIPRGAEISDDSWQVSTPARIGADCRLHGNLRATTIDIGEQTECYGSVRAREDIVIRTGSRVHGDVTTRRGDVTIEKDVQIRGDIACIDLILADTSTVEGAIRAEGEVTIESETFDSVE